MNKKCLPLLLMAVLVAILPASTAAPHALTQTAAPALSSLQRLEKQIRGVFARAEGEVGVALLHIESGTELAVNGDTLFPMASAFKVPLLVEVLYQIKEGKFGLDDEIRVAKTDQHMGSGMLSSLTAPGIVLSVRNLVNLMMLISDNSATDMLLAKIFRKEILDPASCDLILDIMLKCQTGAGRIKGGLQPGTPVAHKTGTIAGSFDDCGIIYLPDGRGHIVLTVWTKNFLGKTEDVEALIAKIARFA